jgi:hypothetical protein
MIVQDVARSNNAQGRCGGSFRDGQFTRYIEVIHGAITITDSDLDGNGKPVVRHQNDDLAGLNFQPLSVTTTKSGLDSKLIVTLVGFTPDTRDSRRVTVKCDLAIKEPWEVYP